MIEKEVFFHIPGIPDFVLMTWIITVVVGILCFIATRRLETIPKGFQNVLEILVGFLEETLTGIIGEEGKHFLPLIGSFIVYILIANLLGLVPGFSSPTSTLNTTIALALVTFFTQHFYGFRKNGIRYLKHFTGPSPWMAPLMFPIELISQFVRPLSLSVRLFGNIMGGDLILAIIALLVPLIVPIPLMFLELLTAFIQAFIFTMLSTIYIAGAIEEIEH
ncbi:MAG: F0F1 ATP synthase subunit A [bacterium]